MKRFIFSEFIASRTSGERGWMQEGWLVKPRREAKAAAMGVEKMG